MNYLDHPRDGGCRCGRVRFRISMLPLVTVACHCRGCQRMTSSAFSLSVAIPSDGFAVIQGDPVPGGLQEDLQHSFCLHCKSWVFTRMPDMDTFINVRSPLIDDLSWTTPFVETFTSEKLDWVTTPAVHRFEKFPATEDWQGLMQAYAAHSLLSSS